MAAIHSVEEFTETFAAGDTYWTIDTWRQEPKGCTREKILEYLHGDDGEVRVRLESRYGAISRYVADITNRWHGAFTTQAEAEAEFAKRREAYIANPPPPESYYDALDDWGSALDSW